MAQGISKKVERNSEAALRGKRKEILEYIHQRIKLDWPPTVREIGTATGLSSPSTVHNHLKILEDHGYLVLGNRPRAIRVLPVPQEKGAE